MTLDDENFAAGSVITAVLALTAARPSETVTNDEREARALALKHPEFIGSPASAFSAVDRAVVARSIDYPDLVEEYGKSWIARESVGAPDDNGAPTRALSA